MKIDPSEGHPAMDYAEHQKTYKLFLKLTLYTIVGVIVLIAVVVVGVIVRRRRRRSAAPPDSISEDAPTR